MYATTKGHAQFGTSRHAKVRTRVGSTYDTGEDGGTYSGEIGTFIG